MENKTALKDTKGANIVKMVSGTTAALTTDITAGAVIAVATTPWVYRGRFKYLKMACVVIGGAFLGASFGNAAENQVIEFVDDTCDLIDGYSEMKKAKKTQTATK